MMPFPKKQKISDEGLKLYLDRLATVHKNKGYDDFVQMLEFEVDRTKIAEKFGVSRDTIYRWIEIHEAEVGHES